MSSNSARYLWMSIRSFLSGISVGPFVSQWRLAEGEAVDVAFDHALHMFVALGRAGDEGDGDAFRAGGHHGVLGVGERERAHAVAFVVGGGVLVTPVADELLDVALGLLAMADAVRGDGGFGFAHKPRPFRIASSRG